MVTIIAPLPAPQSPQGFVLFEWATACFAYYLIYSEVPFLGHLQTLAIHLKVHIFICCSIFSWFWPFSAWNFHKHPRLCLFPPQVEKPRGEKLFSMRLVPLLAMDEVTSGLRQQVVGFGELVLAPLPFQLPKEFVLLAPQPSCFSRFG